MAREVESELAERLADRLAGGVQTPLGDLMRQAHQRLVTTLDDALGAAGWRDVRSAHVSVLATVHPDGSRLTTMTQRGGRTKQAVSELAGHLVDHGYLELVADPSDGRARLYRPTRRGYELLATCERVVDEHERWLVGIVGVEALSRIRVTLETIIASGPAVR
jgi:DNA-binding MarR family transcriptional regulator